MSTESHTVSQIRIEIPFTELILSFIFRSGASLCTDFFAHPFHTIWTVQQTMDNGKHPTFLEACRNICKGSGFFTGVSLSLLSSIPGTCCYLSGRNSALYLFGDNYFGQVMQGPFGIAAGTALWAPASRIVMLKQASSCSSIRNQYSQLSLLGITRKMWNEGGIRSFYRGAFSSILGFMLTDMVGSWLQAQILAYYPSCDRKKITPQLIATWLGFSIATIITSPIEVSTARLRIAESDRKHFSEKTVRQAMQSIYRDHRWRGFYVGLPVAIAYNVFWHSVIPAATVGDAKVKQFCNRN